jgi:hypothetical protein
MTEGLVFVIAGVGWMFVAADPKFTAIGKWRVRILGLGPILAGIGLITGLPVFGYLGAAIVCLVIVERIVTKRPSRRLSD